MIIKAIRDREKLTDAIKKVWKLNIEDNIKEEIFNTLIWKFGEAPNGKYKLRYRSNGSLAITDKKLLHHEHVILRKEIKKKLIEAKNEEEVSEIVGNIETCVVTRKEHEKLHKTKSRGWDRYKDADIKVFDVSGDKTIKIQINSV